MSEESLLRDLRAHQIELETQNDELRRTYAELEVARARYFRLFDMAPVGHLTVDPKDEILEANSTAAQVLGVPKESLVGSVLTRFILPEDQDVFYHGKRSLIVGDSPKTWELRLLKGQIQPIWVRFDAILTRESPDSSVLRLALRDLTTQKAAEVSQDKLEKQIEINQRLKSLGVLAGGIAHDFNNLLGGVFGYVELARFATHEPMVIEYLERAMSVIERTRGLTRQLLTFSTGGAPIQKIGSLAECVTEAARFALSGSNVDCRFEVQDGLWKCNFDSNQIAQVIQNLVINARQAMPKGGTIAISLRNLPLESPQVEITVKDTGPGIPDSILPQVFEPFFTTNPAGTGLGLSVCFSVIRRHGGTIELESKPNEGTRVRVLLPAFPEAITPEPTDMVSPPVIRACSGRILIMDDDASIREILTGLLESLGYSVVATANGQEALSRFNAEATAGLGFDAIILDLTVPGGMGGADTVLEIRKISKSLPVYVVSGYSTNPILDNPTAFGFTAALSKPVSRAQLMALLRK